MDERTDRKSGWGVDRANEWRIGFTGRRVEEGVG